MPAYTVSSLKQLICVRSFFQASCLKRAEAFLLEALRLAYLGLLLRCPTAIRSLVATSVVATTKCEVKYPQQLPILVRTSERTCLDALLGACAKRNPNASLRNEHQSHRSG